MGGGELQMMAQPKTVCRRVTYCVSWTLKKGGGGGGHVLMIFAASGTFTVLRLLSKDSGIGFDDIVTSPTTYPAHPHHIPSSWVNVFGLGAVGTS